METDWHAINHTELSPPSLAWRRVGMQATYLGYIRHLLDTACLPQSHVPRPNMTTMAAMLADLRNRHPDAEHANAVVLGRTLHRAIAGILSWHGGQHAFSTASAALVVHVQTTVYRFPEVRRARQSFEACIGEPVPWANELDQWQDRADIDADDEPDLQRFRFPMRA